MTLTLFITVGLIGLIGGEKGDPNALRKGYRYSKVTQTVQEITTTAKAKDITKIPIRQRTKKPVAGILYAPTSTKAAPAAQTESTHAPTVSTTRLTLPPLESSSTTLLTSSSSALPPLLQSSTYKASPLSSSTQTSGFFYKPTSTQPTAQTQTSGYPNKPTTYNKSSSPRAAITLGYHKQSPSTLSTTTTTSTTSRRLAVGNKGYRHSSNSVNKVVPNVSSEPHTTIPAATKKVHKGRGGYKYKIPEAISPTDDGYVYFKKVVKRQ